MFFVESYKCNQIIFIDFEIFCCNNILDYFRSLKYCKVPYSVQRVLFEWLAQPDFQMLRRFRLSPPINKLSVKSKKYLLNISLVLLRFYYPIINMKFFSPTTNYVMQVYYVTINFRALWESGATENGNSGKPCGTSGLFKGQDCPKFLSGNVHI